MSGGMQVEQNKSLFVDFSVSERISELPDTERIVLTLYYLEGLRLKEIGSLLGVSESRVSQIKARAVGRMRSLLGGPYEDLFS